MKHSLLSVLNLPSFSFTGWHLSTFCTLEVENIQFAGQTWYTTELKLVCKAVFSKPRPTAHQLTSLITFYLVPMCVTLHLNALSCISHFNAQLGDISFIFTTLNNLVSLLAILLLTMLIPIVYRHTKHKFLIQKLRSCYSYWKNWCTQNTLSVKIENEWFWKKVFSSAPCDACLCVFSHSCFAPSNLLWCLPLLKEA